MTERLLSPITATLTSTIANASSISPDIPMLTGTPVAIQMPAAWTAANLTFTASADGVTFYDLYDSAGTEVSVVAAASRFIVFPKTIEWDAIRYMRIRSGTTALPVAQGAARTMIMVYIP
jgi:hypothetical protein